MRCHRSVMPPDIRQLHHQCPRLRASEWTDCRSRRDRQTPDSLPCGRQMARHSATTSGLIFDVMDEPQDLDILMIGAGHSTNSRQRHPLRRCYVATDTHPRHRTTAARNGVCRHVQLAGVFRPSSQPGGTRFAVSTRTIGGHCQIMLVR